MRKAYWLAAGRVQVVAPRSGDLHEPCQDRLGTYCLDIRPALDSGHFDAFDDGGIPLKVFPDGRRFHNPTRTAGYALACFQRLGATGGDAWRENFLRQADWFVGAARPHPTGSLVWPYEFASAGLPAGWISGMAQGQAISVLCRAFLLTGKRAYLDVAGRAWGVLEVPVEGGGLASRFPATGEVCYEEVPLPHPWRVLNGWIFAIWGLGDLSKAANHADAERLYRQGVGVLLAHLADYDTGWWSYYDLPEGRPPRLASFHYHRTDAWLLDALFQRTGQEAFALRGQKWEKYARSPFCRLRALAGKAYQRLRYGY
jgi:hypothetical protein